MPMVSKPRNLYGTIQHQDHTHGFGIHGFQYLLLYITLAIPPVAIVNVKNAQVKCRIRFFQLSLPVVTSDMDLDRSSGSGCSLCARFCWLYKDSRADECALRTREAAGWSAALKVDRSLSVSSIVGVRCPSAGDIKCLGGGGSCRCMMITPSKDRWDYRALSSSLDFSFAVHRLLFGQKHKYRCCPVDWPITREPRLISQSSCPIKLARLVRLGSGCR
jgi:hypothetical protein